MDDEESVEVGRRPRACACRVTTPRGLTGATNGALLAFTSLRGGNAALYVSNGDGGGAHRLTPAGLGAYQGDVAWAPDGSRVVFTCGNFELCVASSDGSGAAPCRVRRGPGGSSQPPRDGAACASREEGRETDRRAQQGIQGEPRDASPKARERVHGDRALAAWKRLSTRPGPNRRRCHGRFGASRREALRPSR